MRSSESESPIFIDEFIEIGDFACSGGVEEIFTHLVCDLVAGTSHFLEHGA